MDDDVIVDPYSRAELFRRGLLRKLTLMKGIRYLRRITSNIYLGNGLAT